MWSSSEKFFSFLVLVSAIAAGTVFSPAAATDHIVGANKGWNPGMNYTSWVNNQTFYVGDLISFRYKKFQYNVFEVNKTGYDNCTTDGAVGNWSSGKDFIPLNEAKRYYFIGGNGQCFNGMKVTVLVHPLPPPPSSSVSANQTSSTVSLPKQSFRALVVVSFVSVFFRFGLI
ncbi:PREDICTED: lamin-like protein [Tarenaya hassleriana]|uniref:lamin-like protein n=1 Tax=Tarenaya hassleriana TaxID=28532 RepID=UPI00053C94BE|nr:PREDICTED: lamin-like protein [Tarenaya hassleriana]